MFQSFRVSQVALRVALAAVFAWFGIGKFIQTQYWITNWLPGWVARIAAAVHMSTANAVILIGIFEVLVAASLVTGFFLQGFAAAGAIALAVTMPFHGMTEVLIRDVGLVGALVALAVWPERRYS